MSDFHLAQFNIAHMLGPIESSIMADFVAQLDAVNALAEATPGFVWRLQTDDGGDATEIRAYENPDILVNMSVWETAEALHEFTYRSGHAVPFRDRKKWFVPIEQPTLVLWWAPAGHVPTVEEGKERLESLREKGPHPEAFSFKDRFPAPVSVPVG